MKHKDEYIKRVYRQIPSNEGYWLDSNHSFYDDYPDFARLFFHYNWIKLYFEDLKQSGCCYVDKHGNVIVRFRWKIFNQTKINF